MPSSKNTTIVGTQASCSGTGEGSPLRILIAEDHPVNRQVCLLTLGKLGWAAEWVANGRELLRILENAQYDVILMGCQMSEMDGYEATRAIREPEQRSPGCARVRIVALTAQAMPGDRERCLAWDEFGGCRLDTPWPRPETRRRMIRAFLFDIGNVLLKFDFSIAERKLAKVGEVADPVEVKTLVDQIKLAYEGGQMDRTAFLRGAAFDLLRYRGSEAEFIAAWEDIFVPNEPMMSLVEELHGRFPLYLLSNTNDIHLEYIFRRYPVFQRFAGGTYSYEAKASKPGREIYGIALRQHRLDPERTFFIDDLLPNIEAARALGFQTHHYHHDRHGELVARLTEAMVS